MSQSPLCGAGMLRVVFDTVIFVRALLNPKSRCGRLLFQYFDRYEIMPSEITCAPYFGQNHDPQPQG
jgi:hypothetical protein